MDIVIMDRDNDNNSGIYNCVYVVWDYNCKVKKVFFFNLSFIYLIFVKFIPILLFIIINFYYKNILFEFIIFLLDFHNF